jgi:CheY-like chemotaxis protein
MSKKILIVEDTRDISEALKLLIEMHGYVVATASSGFAALQMVKNDPPDLIVMDLAMPDLGGEEVVAEIRSDPSYASVPILCVSSYTEGQEAQLLAVGFNEVFSKSAFIISYGPTLRRYLGE